MVLGPEPWVWARCGHVWCNPPTTENDLILAQSQVLGPRTWVWARCGHFGCFGREPKKICCLRCPALGGPLNPATLPWSRAEPVPPRRGWRHGRPPKPVHHRTSVSPRAPPGPRPETAPKLARAPTANPRGTEGFLRHFWDPQEPSKCAS